MDELIFIPASDTPEPILQLANVAAVQDNTAKIYFAGGITLNKWFKVMQTGVSLAVGDRVLVARLSGSYVILGKITY